MADREYGAKLTADPQEFVAGADAAREAQKKLNDEIGKSAPASKSAVDQSRDLVNGLKDQEKALLSNTDRVRALEQATGRLPAVLRSVAVAGGLTATALVALGAVTYALVSRHNEHEQAMTRIVLGLTAQGRAADLTRDQLRTLTDQTGLMAGMTTETATKVVAAYASVRSIGGAAIADVTRLAADFATATGKDVPSAAQTLAKALADPAKGAHDLDAQLGFLNVSQQLAIDRLVAFGQTAQAQGVLVDALKDRIKGLTEQGLSPLGRELAYIREHGAELAGPGPQGDRVLAEGYVPGMSQVYGAAGFTGDARDLALAGNAALAKSGYGVAQQYDSEGQTRLRLQGARAQLQAAAGATGQDAAYYDAIARALANVNEQLAKLDAPKLEQFQRISAHVDALNASLEQQLNSTEKLTQAEQVWNDLVAAVGAGTVKLTNAQIAELNAKLYSAQVTEKAIRAKQEEQKAYEQFLQTITEGRRVQADYLGAQADAEVADAKAIDQIQFETSLIGASNAERQKAIALREFETRAVYLSSDAYEKEKQALIDALDAQASRQQAQDAADAAAKEWKASFERTANNIENAITNAIMRGGQNGRELLEQAMKTAILTPIISPIVRPIAMATSALVQGGVSSLGSALGLGSLFGGGSAAAAGSAAAGGSAAMEAAALTGSGTAVGAGLGAGGITLAGAMPWIAGGLLAASALGVFNDSGPADRSSQFVQGFGQSAGYGAFLNNSWFGKGTESVNTFADQVAMQEQNLIRNLGLSGAQVSSVNSALGGLSGNRYGFGQEFTDWQSSGAGQQIMADRLRVISQTLGRSIEDLTSVMSMSADQWQQALDQLTQARDQAQASLGGLVRGLPGQLGITGIDNFLNSLSTGPDVAPLDRLSSARSIFQSVLGRAQTGDLSAISDLTGAASSYLGIGRDVYASSGDYQSIRAEIEASVNQVRDQQLATQADILKDIPTTIIQSSQDQVAEIRSQTTQLVDRLNAVLTQLRQMTLEVK